jgi:hypothetical protein
VTAHEDLDDQQRAKVVAAAHAVASWARARRASWTTDPLPLPRAAEPIAPPPVLQEPVRVPAPRETPPPPPVAPALPASERSPAVPALAAPPREQATISAAPERTAVPEPPRVRRSISFAPLYPVAVVWLPRVLVAAAVVLAAVLAIRYVPSALTSLTSKVPSRSPEKPAPAAAETAAAPSSKKATGMLRVRSTPAGARVIVDGTPRGVTPVDLGDVAVGHHTVVLESSVGTIQRSVSVSADNATDVDESIFAGFLIIYAPFELAVTEGTHAYRPDDRNEIMLPAGRHDLRLSNRALGFEETRSVDLTPGERKTLSIAPPHSSVTVTATEPAEVWIDGTRIGDTPMNEAPTELGTHEIVVRRAAGGEKRFNVTVTVKPLVLNIDFSKP